MIDLNPITKELNVEENHQLFSINKSIRSEIQNLRSVLQAERKKLFSSSYQEKKTPPPKFDLSSCEIYEKIQAHNDPIIHTNLVKENSLLMTTSIDKKLKLWSISG